MSNLFEFIIIQIMILIINIYDTSGRLQYKITKIRFGDVTVNWFSNEIVKRRTPGPLKWL